MTDDSANPYESPKGEPAEVLASLPNRLLSVVLLTFGALATMPIIQVISLIVSPMLEGHDSQLPRFVEALLLHVLVATGLIGAGLYLRRRPAAKNEDGAPS